MKKLALIAALGAAAIFTACGDDEFVPFLVENPGLQLV
ncbi:hypothetical protein SAMN05720471_1251 [Fibrobacter sp. UWP2]|nr:hypothetical protein SAMN05720471_1251 [Fibrobacter sp. UWP2]